MPAADDNPKKVDKPKGTLAQLLWGAGGIYACFLYYGVLQEDVFRYVSATGKKFEYVWLLQVLEAAANVFVSFVVLSYWGFTRGIPQPLFALTGVTQVFSKWFTNSALLAGVSFPVATLAKSSKMVPVMIGSLFLGGASYTKREYAQVAAIVTGTAVVSLGSGKRHGHDQETTFWGLGCLIAALVCDGLTGGVQKRLKKETTERGLHLGGYDFMFWTNLYMMLTAAIFAILNSEVFTGIAFCLSEPAVLTLIIRFSICSSIGQSFIFYTISTFDPLVTATVTTTRKVLSVLYSIVFKGNPLAPTGWFGLVLASGGILADISGKAKPDEPKKSSGGSQDA